MNPDSNAAMGFDAIIFDMDGVLIDTSRSFVSGVLRAAQAVAVPPGLSGPWTTDHVEILRLAGGFNNDWDAAATIASLGPQTGPGDAWDAVCRDLREAGGGPAAVIRRAGADVWNRVRSEAMLCLQRLYAGPRSRDVYGIEPTEARGLYENEVVLMTAAELLRIPVPFGIYTGRNLGETRLGLELLRLPASTIPIVCDTEERYRKPRPDGVLELARLLRARRVLVVGDSLDDLRSARAAREQGLDAAFAGVAPGESRRAVRFREEGAMIVREAARDIVNELFPAK